MVLNNGIVNALNFQFHMREAYYEKALLTSRPYGIDSLETDIKRQ